MKHVEETRVLSPADVEELKKLFCLLADEKSFFDPHPFTDDEAQRVCFHVGFDLYLGQYSDEKLVAYAMLRGWDKGFEHPSLGIAVHPVFRDSGVGVKVMMAVHKIARRKGAQKVRLRVHSSNKSAQMFYERLGYVFDGEIDRGELVGWVDLLSLTEGRT